MQSFEVQQCSITSKENFLFIDLEFFERFVIQQTTNNENLKKKWLSKVIYKIITMTK